jgi:enoyl-CoA hydratase/carnithine racemase
MTDHILIERSDSAPGVQIIRFNRPEKKNSLTQAMYQKMADGINAANDDDSIGAVAILGTEGCFSAGNDMADFLGFAMSGGVGKPSAFALLEAFTRARKPLISGVDGLAIGIGTTIHMHCDMTIASPRSLFKTPFTDLALVPEAASSLLGPRLMGHQRAFALLAAGEGFSAEQALNAGLIWKIVPEAEVEGETLKLAASIAAKPRQAVTIARDLLRYDSDEVRARMEQELKHFVAQLVSAEAKAAFEAFMAKR